MTSSAIFELLIFDAGIPALIIAYFIVPARFRNIILLLFSLGFYAWGGLRYLAIMLVSIAINYCFGILVSKVDDDKRKQKNLVMSLAVIANLLLLGYFKYTDFIIRSLNGLLKTDIPLRNIVLPIGFFFIPFRG